MQDNTDENGNITEQWEGDVFERKKYADFLTEYLADKNRPFVLNVNSIWGAGKTFFLTHWYDDIKSTHPAVIFNAWENDFVDDPLLTVLASIKKTLTPLLPVDAKGKTSFDRLLSHSGRFLKAVGPVVARGITRKALGEGGMEELANIIPEDEQSMTEFSGKATESLLKIFSSTKTSITNFQESLEDLVDNVIEEQKDLSGPLFIFIDELDRCRPTFAIETLERIKHLFSVPNVVFVVATDTEQLSHSVRAIYGEGFEGRTYLKRFFNQEYTLPQPDFMSFARMLFQDFERDIRFFSYNVMFDESSSLLTYAEPGRFNEYTLSSKEEMQNKELVFIFSLMAQFFDLDLRTQKQCFEMFDAITLTVKSNEEFHSAYMLFLIMLKAKEPSLFDQYFRENSHGKRHNVIDGISNTLINISSSAKLYSVKSILGTYQKYTLMARQNITAKNQNEIGLAPKIASSIFNNYENLQGYKSRVELVETFS